MNWNAPHLKGYSSAMWSLGFIAIVASAAICPASLAAPPPHIAEVAAGAFPDGAAVAWCEGRTSENLDDHLYAVAVAHGQNGGTYLIHHAGKSTSIGDFSSSPEVQCMPVAQARKLNETIKQSEGIHGGMELSGPGAVVCVFVEPTQAECWQYSPSKRSFFRAGGWET